MPQDVKPLGFVGHCLRRKQQEEAEIGADVFFTCVLIEDKHGTVIDLVVVLTKPEKAE